ncbi:MAG: efflux RND transporter periplasmic adaptor subunit [Gammaproteobacteria bacterium]|nr:efflux RND transporter periplasmic adaptor subunit [Gammaproteobacteria bacterium]
MIDTVTAEQRATRRPRGPRGAARLACAAVLLAAATPLAAGEYTTGECVLEPAMVVDLSSPVIGVIARVRVDRGDTVRRGQPVVELRAEVEQAEVDLHRAELEFGRVTSQRNAELYAQKLISAQELDEVEIKTRVAGLELAAAEARTRQRIITSPIDGVVLARLMDPGEYVGEEAILRLADLDPLHVEAVLPRELFGAITAEAEAEVTLGEPLGGTRTAHIAVIDPVIDAASGTFGVRLVLPNPDHAIPAGLKCAVRFATTVEAP